MTNKISAKPAKPAEPKLLSGGNPQIVKGEGDGRCRPISPPCPAGKVMSADASMR